MKCYEKQWKYNILSIVMKTEGIWNLMKSIKKYEIWNAIKSNEIWNCMANEIESNAMKCTS